MLNILQIWLILGSLTRCEVILSGSLDLGSSESSFNGISALVTDATGVIVGQTSLFDSGKFVLSINGQGSHRVKLVSSEDLPFEPAYIDFNTADLNSKLTAPSFNFRLQGVRFLAKVYLKSGGDNIAYVEPTVVCLFENGTLKQEVKTDKEGVAVFNNLRPGKNLFVLCGKTHHKISSGEMTCHITFKTERCENNLSYEEFTLFGTVEGLPEDHKDAVVVFNAPEKEIVCPFLKPNDNTFVCRNMIVGRFVVSVRSSTASFTTTPESLEVKKIASVTLKASQVFKLTISGPEGVKVFFNGKEETILGKVAYCKEGLSAQTINVSLRHYDYDFEDRIVSLIEGANSAQELKITPSRLALCGTLVGFSDQEVQVFSDGKLIDSVPPRRDEFCFMLPQGKYSVEARDPSGFLVAKEVELSNSAIKNLELKPREVAATVEIAYLEEPETPENAHLLNLIRAAQAKTVVKVFNLGGTQLKELRFDESGKVCLSGLGVSAVRLRIINPEMCFAEFEQSVDARHTRVVFTQRGFLHSIQTNQKFRAVVKNVAGEHSLDLSSENRLTCLPVAKGTLEGLSCHTTDPVKLPLIFPFTAPSIFHLRSVAVNGSVQVRGDQAFAKRVAESLTVEGIDFESFHARVDGQLVRYSFRYSPKAHVSARLRLSSPDQNWFLLKGDELNISLSHCSDASPNAIVRPGFVVVGKFPRALPDFVVEGFSKVIRGSGSGFKSEVLESLENLRVKVKCPGYLITEDLRTRNADGSLLIEFLIQEAHPLKILFVNPSGTLFTKEPITLNIIQNTNIGESSFTKVITSGELIISSENFDQYIIPSLKEYSFTPTQIFVNGAKTLNQELKFVVSKTSFSLRGLFNHSLKLLPADIYLEAVPINQSLPTEISRVLPSGEFSVKGLKSNESYVIRLRSHEEVTMVPPEFSLTMDNQDKVFDLNLVSKTGKQQIQGAIDYSILEAETPSDAPYRLIINKAVSNRYEKVLDFEVDDPKLGMTSKGPIINKDAEEIKKSLCSSFRSVSAQKPVPPKEKSIKVDDKKETKKIDVSQPQKEKEKSKTKDLQTEKYGKGGLLSIITVIILLSAAGFFAFSRLI